MSEKNEHGSIRAMLASDLEMVLAWRNHSEVRRHMFSTEPITLADHRAWFEKKQCEPNVHLMIYEHEGPALGFVTLHETTGQRRGEWGFYARPDAPKGTGKALGAAAIDHAFRALNWHRIVGLTLASNERSIRMHRALGFQLEGRFREHHFDGASHVDVCSFGLLRSEWTAMESNE